MEEEGPERSLKERIRTLFRRRGTWEDPQEMEREIQDLLDAGEEQGFLSGEEGEMIQGILDLKDIAAREVMVPRTDMVLIPLEARISDIIQIVMEKGYSRLPVFEGDFDHILGVLHVKDLLKFWGHGNEEMLPREIIREPYFVPESKKIGPLLKDLRNQNKQIAIVIDEYGGTAGLITIEDILEEVVGEIQDEYDLNEEKLVALEDGSVKVDARLDVEELAEYFHITLPEGKFESVGGLLIALTGRVLSPQERVTYGDLEFIVQSADERKVKQVLVRKMDAPRLLS